MVLLSFINLLIYYITPKIFSIKRRVVYGENTSYSGVFMHIHRWHYADFKRIPGTDVLGIPGDESAPDAKYHEYAIPERHKSAGFGGIVPDIDQHQRYPGLVVPDDPAKRQPGSDAVIAEHDGPDRG